MAWAMLLPAISSATPRPVFEPPTNRDYLSTREIRRLEVAFDGELWAETNGGARRLQNGVWHKLATPTHQFSSAPLPVKWRGQSARASWDGLRIGDGEKARVIALPRSSGTHISAVLPRGAALWVAIFGDGIWEWNGKWRPLDFQLPPAAREITALAQSRDGVQLWVGTRRQGVWGWKNQKWTQHLVRDEPFAHNIQHLHTFRGALWASTLEDGLIVRDAAGWKHIEKGVLSSNAPRQMASFQGRLYVRHSNEVVDCFDGKTWAKHVFPNLPRRQIISLAADSQRLYLGQWGGWSEWDGRAFSHHLKHPALQIVPLMQILPDGDTLWLGTENRGLFRWNRAQRRLDSFDERDGLPDDWITSLHRHKSDVFAGTFQGGLAWLSDRNPRWQSAPSLRGAGITSLAAQGDHLWIGTHFGLLERVQNGEFKARNDDIEPPQRQIQALLRARNGLWIGTRNGLLFRSSTVQNGTLLEPLTSH